MRSRVGNSSTGNPGCSFVVGGTLFKEAGERSAWVAILCSTCKCGLMMSGRNMTYTRVVHRHEAEYNMVRSAERDIRACACREAGRRAAGILGSRPRDEVACAGVCCSWRRCPSQRPTPIVPVNHPGGTEVCLQIEARSTVMDRHDAISNMSMPFGLNKDDGV